MNEDRNRCDRCVGRVGFLSLPSPHRNRSPVSGGSLHDGEVPPPPFTCLSSEIKTVSNFNLYPLPSTLLSPRRRVKYTFSFSVPLDRYVCLRFRLGNVYTLTRLRGDFFYPHGRKKRYRGGRHGPTRVPKSSTLTD